MHRHNTLLQHRHNTLLQHCRPRCQHHLAGKLLRARQRQITHLLRLPGLAIIAIFLSMSNRRAEMHAINGANG